MSIIVNKPRLCTVLLLLFGALAAAGATKLTINSDNRILFSRADVNRQALDRFEARYTAESNLLIALHTDDGDVFTLERLAAISSMTEAAWRLPYATRVDSITNATHISSDAEGVIIDEMAPKNALAAGNVDEIRQRVLDDKLLVGRIIAPDGKTTAINVSFNYPLGESSAPATVVKAARDLTAPATDFGFETWLGGRVASSDAFSTAAKTDMKTLTVAGYISIFVIVGLMLRSFWCAFALLISILIATAAAMGLGGWAGFSINAATSAGPTVILTLGVATLIHYVTAFQARLMTTRERKVAALAALDDMQAPIALALGTTAAGFLTLNFAESPPFRELGNFTAAGAGFSLLFGLTLLPALLCILPVQAPRRTPPIQSIVNRAANFAIDQRRILLFAMPATFAVIAAGIFLISIDDDLIAFFDHRFQYRLDTDAIEQNLTGLEIIEFDIGAEEENAIFDPVYMAKLDAFGAWLEQQPKVAHVSSVTEIFKRLNRHVGDAGLDSDTFAETPDALAQHLLVYEMSLPLGRSLTDAITIDRSASRLSVIMNDASTAEVRALKDAGQEWLSVNGAAQITGAGTGLAVMYAYLSSVNIDNMTSGTLLALVFISAVLVIAFRSLKYGVLSLIPNLMPVVIAFGVWGYLVGQVGVVASAVGAATLGIIVDDTVHLMWRYLKSRRAGEDPETAVRAMFKDVGRPMITSTIALVIGFGVLATSGFQITAHLGALCAITIIAALVADWFFLPPLLLAIDAPLTQRIKATPDLRAAPAGAALAAAPTDLLRDDDRQARSG